MTYEGKYYATFYITNSKIFESLYVEYQYHSVITAVFGEDSCCIWSKLKVPGNAIDCLTD